MKDIGKLLLAVAVPVVAQVLANIAVRWSDEVLISHQAPGSIES
jgi:hypothetical protein